MLVNLLKSSEKMLVERNYEQYKKDLDEVISYIKILVTSGETNEDLLVHNSDYAQKYMQVANIFYEWFHTYLKEGKLLTATSLCDISITLVMDACNGPLMDACSGPLLVQMTECMKGFCDILIQVAKRRNNVAKEYIFPRMNEFKNKAEKLNNIGKFKKILLLEAWSPIFKEAKAAL